MSSQANLPLFVPGADRSVPGYDEAFGADGRPRPHWVSFMAQYQMLGASGLQERVERARQLSADTGISLGYHSGSRDDEEWLFDVMPLILTGEEWRYIEAGIIQRAQVLDHLLADLYGPQETLRKGLFPPYLVYGNPNYLRPLRRDATDMAEYDPERRHLQVYATDLVRRPDGHWTIVADRTQVPTGAGFALANRRTLARAMPEVFTNQQIRSCHQFFKTWADGLKAMATGAQGSNPRVALLTPGPFAPGYYEHVYLAREMDIALVEGADLTVRGDKLLLKELGGLQPIDVLLRRLDGDFCDPLDLRPGSLLGVSGLAHLQREGRLQIANSIGSGAIETPALFPFLPRLCQELLGETQLAVSAETWWCGQPEILRRVLDRLDDYIILPAFYGGDGYPNDPTALSPSARAELIDDMRREPERYVAQERLVPSQAPMISGQIMQSNPVVLRVFTVAGPNGYEVLPGGFARLPVSGSPFSGILADGSITKDVWVLNDEAAPSVQYPLPISTKKIDLVRSTGGLQSRVADNLFWLGRHMARIEVSVRLLRAVFYRLYNATEGSGEYREINCLTGFFRSHGLVDWEEGITPETPATIPETLLAATAGDGPLANDFAQTRRLMMGLRDRCSSDMWEILSEFTGPLADRLQHAAGDIDLSLHVFDEVLQRCASFAGIVAEGMVRGTGWSFLGFGRRLETAFFGLRLASSCCGAINEPGQMQLRLALELGDTLITYRNRYLSQLHPRPVLDLLLTDDTNPKSVVFQINAMMKQAEGFPYRRHINAHEELREVADSLGTMIDLFKAPEELSADAENAASLELDRLVFEAESILNNLSGQIYRGYFLHSEDEHVLRADWRPSRARKGQE